MSKVRRGGQLPRILAGVADTQAIEALRLSLSTDHELRVATTGDQVLELARSSPGFDLILIEAELPTLNGFLLCRALKSEESTRPVPVLLLLDPTASRRSDQVYESGAADHLCLPFDAPTLRARVRTHLELRHLRELTGSALALDPVTQVADEQGVQEFIDLEWKRAAREATALSLILLRVDFFQGLIANQGRPAADECLRLLAGELAASIRRPMDFLGRHDEDGFAVVLPVTEAYGAVYLAELMRQGVETLSLLNDGSAVSSFVTISAGVATAVPSPQSNAEDFWQAAERGLELSILGGGNRVRAVEPSWP